MPILDLTAYKPAAGGALDAIQIDNGFQAIVNCINALDAANFAAGLIFDPAKIMQAGALDGDALVWDNTLGKWKPASAMAAGRPRAPRVVVSSMAGGPPASPVDQDIWIATAVDATSTRWGFQYNAGSASAFKWEFIGGSDVTTNDGAVEATSSSASFVEADTLCRITVARAGDYIVRGAGRLKTSTTSNTLAQAAVGTTSVPGLSIIGEARVAVAAVSSSGYAGEVRLNGAAAGATFCQGIRNGSGDGTTIAYDFRTLAVIPARIS